MIIALLFVSMVVGSRSQNEGCGGILNDTNGIVNSPNYPADYNNNTECGWQIEAPVGQHILINFTAMNIEYSGDCHYDSLVVYNGPNASSPELGPFCGSESPGIILSQSNSLYVVFVADESDTDTGFEFEYSRTTDGCGGILNDVNGIVNSPNYPANYNNSDECVWQIQAQEGEHIVINFNAMNIEYSSNCHYDSLVVYNGPNDSSPELGRFCGSKSPGIILSRSNSIYVVFVADESLTDAGFEFEYSRTTDACGGYLNGSSGILTSPCYPDDYNNNIECPWYITNPTADRSILFRLTDFQLEDSYLCHYDLLEFYEGSNSLGTSMGRFCGNKGPTGVVSTPFSNVYIRFKTDSSAVGKGFGVYYEFTECGGILAENYGVIRSPNYPRNYNSNDGCAWKIVAPKDRRILLTFTTMQIEDAERCSYDYLEFLDGPYTSLGWYCGTASPAAIFSPGNTLRILFVTDASVTGAGFELHYQFV